MDPALKEVNITLLQDVINKLFTLDNPNKISISTKCDNYELIISYDTLELFRNNKRTISDIFNINANIIDMIIILKSNVGIYFEFNCTVRFSLGCKILADKFYAKVIIPNTDESMNRCNAEIFSYYNYIFSDLLANDFYLPNIQRIQVDDCIVEIKGNDIFVYTNSDTKKLLNAIMPNLFAIENIRNDDVNCIYVICKSNTIIDTNNFVYETKIVCENMTMYTNKYDVNFSVSIAQIELVEPMCKNANK